MNGMNAICARIPADEGGAVSERKRKCGAKRRWYSCRCSREAGHAGKHRCERSGVSCRVTGGPKLGKGPFTAPGEWR